MRRRSMLGSCAAVAASAIVMPALASSRRTIAPMTDGPFYPPRDWRERSADWDADLTRVQRDGRTLRASGEWLGLGHIPIVVLAHDMTKRLAATVQFNKARGHHQVDLVTIGQYLSPGPKHLPVDRFVTPEQFEHFRRHGEQELGFLQVVSSPLTRSSYHAGEVQRLMARYPR